VKEKIIRLVTSLAAIAFSAACGVQWAEFVFNSDPKNRISLFDAFYFTIVTISTVGYGDVTPKTVFGKVIVIFVILTALAIIPKILGGLLDAVANGTKGTTNRVYFRTKYAVVVSMDPDNEEQIIDMLEGLVDTRCAGGLKVVLLCNHDLSITIKEILRRPKYNLAVIYIRGIINYDTIKRSGLKHAEACFILRAKSSNETMADMDSILRVLTICSTVAHIPIFVYTISPDSEQFVCPPAQDTACLSELKQLLMGYNVLFEGTSTLVTNLLLHATQSKEVSFKWQDEYTDGSANHFSHFTVLPVFVGKSFCTVTWFLYQELQIIPIAVYASRQKHDQYKNTTTAQTILLNPGRDYIFREGDQLIYIGQSDDINKLLEFHEPEEIIKKMYVGEEFMFCGKLRLAEYSTYGSGREFSCDFGKLAVMPYIPPYELPPTREPPLCVQMVEEGSLEESVLDEIPVDCSDHIIIIGSNKNIYSLLSTIRAGYLDLGKIVPIVILQKEPPCDRQWKHVKFFPNMRFVIGDCMMKDDLIRAGVGCASTVVIDFVDDMQKEERFADARTVLAYNLVKTLVTDTNKTRILTGLETRISANFFRLKAEIPLGLHSDDVLKEREEFLHSSAYASGRIIVPEVLDSILIQSWMAPYTIDLVKLLCGARYPGTIKAVQRLTGKPKTVHLSSIIIPPEFIGHSFQHMFKQMLFKHDALPIGLLRKDIGLDNIYPFVYTNPLPDTILHANDQIYVLVEDH
jgi:hypothetical protein